MFEVSVKGDIASSHILHGYPGKCKDLHGHTWKVEVTIAGEKLDPIGLLVDFRKVKKDLHELLETLDHKHLNDLPAFKDVNPSTENLAKHIYEEFVKTIAPPLRLKKVTVWESELSRVTYYR